jgi:hypothetical protein
MDGALGRLIASQALACVVDVSELGSGAVRRRSMATFAGAIYAGSPARSRRCKSSTMKTYYSLRVSRPIEFARKTLKLRHLAPPPEPFYRLIFLGAEMAKRKSWREIPTELSPERFREFVLPHLTLGSRGQHRSCPSMPSSITS